MGKLTICVDFDGVIHSYKSGWKGYATIPDEPVEGAIEWLTGLVDKFDVAIYSSRSKSDDGIQAMRDWLINHGMENHVLSHISFPDQKPAAFLTIDDRCICFNGHFPSAEDIKSFVPWYKKKESRTVSYYLQEKDIDVSTE